MTTKKTTAKKAVKKALKKKAVKKKAVKKEVAIRVPSKKEIVVQEQHITDPALLTKVKIDLIKRTVAKGSTDDELEMFLMVCKRSGLDPFTKQIHLVKRWVKSENRNVATVQTGIDGYRAIAEKTGKYGGSNDAILTFKKEGDKIPLSATVSVYKIMGDRTIEIKATAYWDEFAPTNEKLAFMWNKMPKLMLAKCAEALALRKSFPNVLSDIYTNEEMQQAVEIASVEVASNKISEENSKSELLKTLANSKAYIFTAKSLKGLGELKERILNAKDLDKDVRKRLEGFCKEKKELLKKEIPEEVEVEEVLAEVVEEVKAEKC